LLANLLARDVMSPRVCVLREVCRAPEAPLEVENLMESALSYHNSSQYDLAINAYIAARTKWLEWMEMTDMGGKGAEEDEDGEGKMGNDIPPRAAIFVLCGIGSVHESAGNDEMAQTCYLDAQRTGESLGFFFVAADDVALAPSSPCPF